MIQLTRKGRVRALLLLAVIPAALSGCSHTVDPTTNNVTPKPTATARPDAPKAAAPTSPGTTGAMGTAP